jgi:hypothetical protein
MPTARAGSDLQRIYLLVRYPFQALSFEVSPAQPLSQSRLICVVTNKSPREVTSRLSPCMRPFLPVGNASAASFAPRPSVVD